MKFLIIGDLHGQMPTIKYDDYDAILAPGDFCSDEPRTLMFENLKKRMADPTCREEWWESIGKEKAKAMIEKSLADGRKILEELNEIGKPVYVVPGNWDWAPALHSNWIYLRQDHFTPLLEGLENVHNAHHVCLDAGDFQIIGHGISSGPEVPQEEDDKKLYSEIELELMDERYGVWKHLLMTIFLQATKPVIFLTHNVPYDTPLDEIKDPNSPRVGKHYGSIIARDVVESYEPIVCVGGHMHEHFGSCEIHTTKVINAGYGSHVNVFLEVDGEEVKKLEFNDK